MDMKDIEFLNILYTLQFDLNSWH